MILIIAFLCNMLLTNAQKVSEFTDYRVENLCADDSIAHHCMCAVIDIEMPSKMSDALVLDSIRKQLTWEIFHYSENMSIDDIISIITNNTQVLHPEQYDKYIERYSWQHYFDMSKNDSHDFYFGRTAYNSNGIYSMHMYHSGLHPNFFFVERLVERYITFNVSTGQLLSWIDLFQPQHLNVLDSIVCEQLAGNHSKGVLFDFEELMSLPIHQRGSFTISDKGLVLLYHGLDIICGVCEPLEIIIPSAMIKKYLRREWKHLW